MRAARFDLDVAEFQEHVVQRIDCLVDGFLGGEEKFSAQRIVGDPAQLVGRGDQIEHLRRQRYHGLDVDTDRAEVARRARRPRLPHDRREPTSRQLRRARPARRTRPRGTGVASCPSCARSCRATIRAAPLARRTSMTGEAIEAASSSRKAFSSPCEIRRWATSSPGGAILSMSCWSFGSTVLLEVTAPVPRSSRRLHRSRLPGSRSSRRTAWRPDCPACS